jgi:hypothetical protein
MDFSELHVRTLVQHTPRQKPGSATAFHAQLGPFAIPAEGTPSFTTQTETPVMWII